jgi:hypothetical protein
MTENGSHHQKLARRLATSFSEISTVEAIALGGSQAQGVTDPNSDIDLYVYTTSMIPLSAREALVRSGRALRADLNLQFWDLGDEWFDAETGIEVDVIYWEPAWIEGQLDRLWRQHQASLGYSTCFWHTVRHSRALYDRHGWFQTLQERSQQPYPEALRDAIIAKNYPVLRQVIPSYANQITKACQRGDRVSLNHRVAALLASYFDVLFALNRVLHPGEKRLVEWALNHCALLPADMAQQVDAVLHATCSADETLLIHVNTMLDGLDMLVRAEGFSTTSLPVH